MYKYLFIQKYHLIVIKFAEKIELEIFKPNLGDRKYCIINYNDITLLNLYIKVER